MLFNKSKTTATHTYNHNGFTLAEVLITLVIIGVVAALTVPNLINNHRKTEVETRLKSAYSILANMFKAAEADNGSFSTWDFSEFTGQSTSREDVRDAFINKYMLPYLKIASDKTQTFGEFGYKKIITPDGTDYYSMTDSSRFLTLANGMVFWTRSYGAEINNGNIINYYMYIFADIDGPNRGTNTLGKDIFAFHQMFLNGFPLSMVGERSTTACRFESNNDEWTRNFIQTNKCTIAVNLVNGAITFTDFKFPRETILNNCKTGARSSSNCGALIRMDGWRIADDYPWL